MIDARAARDPRIVELPRDAALVLVAGEPASGKTEALARRYAALIARDGISPERTLVAASSRASARALVARIATLFAGKPEMLERAPFVGVTLDALGFAIVREGALAGGLAPDLERLEPYEAEEIFERAAAPLFSADWADYLGAEIDPEISGLRAPDRFATAVLRLIVKLRDAEIGPEDFLRCAQRGAARFYAQPPNLADPDLLIATRDEYRSSLTVDPTELERQRRREIDLAKIVAKLYRSYLDQLVERGCLGPGDAIAEAIRLLREQPALARVFRERIALAVVDDAQDLRGGEVRLLQALFGDALAGVTFAGSLATAIRTFAGARPDATFKLAATTIVVEGSEPSPSIAAAARAVAGRPAISAYAGDAVQVQRLPNRTAEAAFVGDRIAALVATGTPPARVALLHRTARTLVPFEDALIERDVPLRLHGDIDLLGRADVQDALAMLWSAVDPFRHDWLLRALQTPIVALSDASLATLCGEPADPQAMLFPLPAEDSDGDRRWDRRRDVRLATNVLRGERDADLTPVARERIEAFRARRARWAAHARDAGARAAADIVADSGLLFPREPEPPVRAGRRAALIGELLSLIERYAVRYRGGSLEDALLMLERVAAAERGPVVDGSTDDGVFVGAIEQLGPRRFDHVFVVDVRAGAFPPYYVPDAFLFSSKWGMIPKDAVGDGTAARTAKFTWYLHHAKLRDVFAAEHRRMLVLAMTRADRSVTVTTNGKPTRGIGTPELAVELNSWLATVR